MIAVWIILAQLTTIAAGARYDCDFTPENRCCWYFAGETNPLMMNSIRSSASAQIIPRAATDLPSWILLSRQRFPPRAPYLQLSTGNASAVATAVWASCPLCSEAVNVQLAFRHWMSPTAQLSVCVRHNIDETDMNLTDPKGVDCIAVAPSTSNFANDYVSAFPIIIRPRKPFVLFLRLRSQSSVWRTPATVFIDHIHVSMQKCADRVSVGGTPSIILRRILNSTSPNEKTSHKDGRKFYEPPSQTNFIGNWKSGTEFKFDDATPTKQGSKVRLNVTSALITYQKIERKFEEMAGLKQKATVRTTKLNPPTHFIDINKNQLNVHKDTTKFDKIFLNYGRDGTGIKKFDDVSAQAINVGSMKNTANFTVRDSAEKRPDPLAALFNIDLHVTRKDSHRLEKYEAAFVKRRKSYGTSSSMAHRIFPINSSATPLIGRDSVEQINIPIPEKNIHRKQSGLLADPTRRHKYDNAQTSSTAFVDVLKSVVFSRPKLLHAEIRDVDRGNISGTAASPLSINVANTLSLRSTSAPTTALSSFNDTAENFGDEFAAFLEPSFRTEP